MIVQHSNGLHSTAVFYFSQLFLFSFRYNHFRGSRYGYPPPPPHNNNNNRPSFDTERKIAHEWKKIQGKTTRAPRRQNQPAAAPKPKAQPKQRPRQNGPAAAPKPKARPKQRPRQVAQPPPPQPKARAKQRQRRP